MIRVAIDGPAGVGKSSTSKALAKYFNYAYLDTGAMYRACAWWCLKSGIDLDSGKNRIVRRIFGSIGFPVKRLVRTQIGPIKLGELKPGSYRVLSQAEVRSLSKEVGL